MSWARTSSAAVKGPVNRRSWGLWLWWAVLCLVTGLGPASRPALAESEPSGEELLQRYVRALGGRPGAAHLQLKGQLEHGPLVAGFQLFISRPGQLRYEQIAPGFLEVQAINGEKGWSRQANAVVRGLSPEETLAMRLLRDALSRPWLDPASGFVLGQVREADAGRQWQLAVTAPDGMRCSLYFDAGRFLLRKVEAWDGTGQVSWSLDDFRKIDRVEYPFLITGRFLKPDLEDIVTLEVADARPVTALEPRLFQRPTSGQGKVSFPAGETQVQVPIRYIAGREKVLVQAVVDDAPPLWFLLDSSAPYSVFDTGLVLRLELPLVKRRLARDFRGTHLEALYSVRRIALGGVELAGTVAGTEELDEYADLLGTSLSGILGRDVFDRLVVTLDYRQGRLILQDPTNFQPPSDTPMLLLDDQDCISVMLNGYQEMPMLVDTGSEAAVVLPASTRLDIPPSDGARVPVQLLGQEGSVPAFLVRLPSLTLDRVTVPSVVAALEEPRARQRGLPARLPRVGNQLLERFIPVLDYPHRRVWLEPSVGPDRPFRYNRSGLRLASAESLTVEQVLPQAETTVQVGDRLMGVLTPEGWSRNRADIMVWLREGAGTRLSLLVVRSGVELEAELTLKELL